MPSMLNIEEGQKRMPKTELRLFPENRLFIVHTIFQEGKLPQKWLHMERKSMLIMHIGGKQADLQSPK